MIVDFEKPYGSGHDMLLKPSTTKGTLGFDEQRPAGQADVGVNLGRGSVGRRCTLAESRQLNS
jgi:hypothetical protein